MRNAIHIQAIEANDSYSGKPEAVLRIYHAHHHNAVEVHHSFSNAAIGCISGWVEEGYVVLSDEENVKEDLSRRIVAAA